MTQQDKAKVTERTLFTALKTLREALEGGIAHRQSMMTVRQLELLLRISEHEGVSQIELIKETGLSAGTISKNIITMGSMITKDADGKPVDMGMGLIEQKHDVFDSRKKLIYLTTTGKDAIARFLEELRGARQ